MNFTWIFLRCKLTDFLKFGFLFFSLVMLLWFDRKNSNMRASFPLFFFRQFTRNRVSFCSTARYQERWPIGQRSILHLTRQTFMEWGIWGRKRSTIHAEPLPPPTSGLTWTPQTVNVQTRRFATRIPLPKFRRSMLRNIMFFRIERLSQKLFKSHLISHCVQFSKE